MGKRTISEIKVSDVDKRRLPSKHYVYVIHVTWSDGTTNIVYRRYSRFFDLQNKLLDMFPIESGVVDPAQRIIPFLPGKIIFGRSQIRDVALKRMPQIDSYCKTLVSLNTKISQSEEVLDFFEMEPEDWNPQKEGSASKKVKADKISKPKVSEQYVCIADYEKEAKGEVTLKTGMTVQVIEKDESGWWFVNSEEEQGWVPSTYLERDDGVSEVAPERAKPGEDSDSDSALEEKYICTETISPGGPDELSLEKGAIVEVLEKRLDGWWLVRYKDQEGLAPGMYLAKTESVQSQHLSKMVQAPGVQIVSSLSDVSNLFRKSGDFDDTGPTQGNRQSSPRGASVAVLLKSRSLERKSAIKPPPRQNSKSNLVLHTKPKITAAKTFTHSGTISINRSSITRKSGPDKTFVGYVTLADFEDTVGDGISFKQGENVTIIEKSDSGWWCVKIGDKEGWAPSSYIGEQTQEMLYESIADFDEQQEFDCTDETPAQPQTPSFADQLRSKVQNPDSSSVSVQKAREKSGFGSTGPSPISTSSGSVADELRSKLKPVVPSGNTSQSSRGGVVPAKPLVVPKGPGRPRSGDFTNSNRETNDSSELTNVLKSKFEARNKAYKSDENLNEKVNNDSKSKGNIPNKPLVFPTKSNSDKTDSSQGESSTNVVKPTQLKPKPPKPSKPAERPITPPKPKDSQKPIITSSKPAIAGKKPTLNTQKDSPSSNNVKSNPENSSQAAGGIASVLSKFQSPSNTTATPSQKEGPNEPKISSIASKFEKSTKPAIPTNRPKPKIVPKPMNSNSEPTKTTTWNVSASTKKTNNHGEDIPKPNIANLRNALKSKLETTGALPEAVSTETTQKQSIKKQPSVNKNVISNKQEQIQPPVTVLNTEAGCYVTCAAFTGQSDSELTFEKGQVVEVIEKMDSWWFVTINGNQGYAPADYIEDISNTKIISEPITETQPASTGSGQSENSSSSKYITLAAFTAQNEGEVSFEEGVEVGVVQEDDGGWWLISVSGQEGWAPADFLQPI